MLALCVFFVALSPAAAFAHQPRIVEGTVIDVPEPEISKAYYGTLSGAPHVFHIASDKPFNLYVNILVPDIVGQKTDVSATVLLRGATTSLALLGGAQGEWKKMFEEFGHDNYLQSGEYKTLARAGEYDVVVTSAQNDSKYSLAIGETESFDMREGWNALVLVPELKRNFFNESPIGFILSPMGAGYVIAMFLLAALFGFAYRFLIRFYARKSKAESPRTLIHNIDTRDRLLRAFFGLVLFFVAITTNWSPWLLFAAGFCFFEALFSWCGLYAALGRSTCPVE
jgi:hypothetical protein